MLALISLTIAGLAQDRTVRIANGSTTHVPLTFTAADSLAGRGGSYIVTSDSIVLLFTNPQKFQQHQVFTTTLETHSGSPSVVITLRGKVTSTDSWHPIGSAVTWTSSANNPRIITSTTPINYNYLKVSYVGSGAAQSSKVVTAELKTSNAYDVPANSGTLTIARATTGAVTITTKDNDANAATTYRAGGTGALTLGASTGTTAITSSDWAIGATGIMTGIGAITSNGLITGTAGATLSGAAISLNASSNFATNIGTGSTNAAVTIGGGSNTVAIASTAMDVSTTGAVTGVTDLTASGVITGGFRHLTPVTNTDASETLTAAQSGAFVVATAAGGATTITIPDPSAATVGVIYYIVQTADQDLILTATTANSNSIVCDHIATTDNVTISTASHKIGSGMFVIGISATKWYVGGLNPESVLTPEAAD